MFDQAFINERRAELLKRKQEIEGELQELRKVPDLGSHGDTFEEETEIDEAEEYVTNLSKIPALERDFQEIADALSDIEKGAYGVCKQCGKPISKELLKVAPESRLCKACKLARPYRKNE